MQKKICTLLCCLLTLIFSSLNTFAQFTCSINLEEDLTNSLGVILPPNNAIICANEPFNLPELGFQGSSQTPNPAIIWAIYSAQPTQNCPEDDPANTGIILPNANGVAIFDAGVADLQKTKYFTAASTTFYLVPIIAKNKPDFQYVCSCVGINTDYSYPSFTVLNPQLNPQCGAQCTAPINDACTDASPLTIGSNGNFNNECSTASADGTPPAACFSPFDNVFQHTVWFTFEGTGGKYTFTTQNCTGSPNTQLNNTQMVIYEGACNALANLACNDDNPNTNSMAQVVDFQTTAGTTYYIVIDGVGTAQGEFCIDVKETAPPPICSLIATATASECNANTGNYTLTVTLQYENALVGDSILVQFSNGIKTGTIAIAPNGNQTIQINDLTADGLLVTFDAFFKENQACTSFEEYLTPQPCLQCTANITNFEMLCDDNDDLFLTATFTVNYENAFSNNLIVAVDDVVFQTFTIDNVQEGSIDVNLNVPINNGGENHFTAHFENSYCSTELFNTQPICNQVCEAQAGSFQIPSPICYYDGVNVTYNNPNANPDFIDKWLILTNLGLIQQTVNVGAELPSDPNTAYMLAAINYAPEIASEIELFLSGNPSYADLQNFITTNNYCADLSLTYDVVVLPLNNPSCKIIITNPTDTLTICEGDSINVGYEVVLPNDDFAVLICMPNYGYYGFDFPNSLPPGGYEYFLVVVDQNIFPYTALLNFCTAPICWKEALDTLGEGISDTVTVNVKNCCNAFIEFTDQPTELNVCNGIASETLAYQYNPEDIYATLLVGVDESTGNILFANGNNPPQFGDFVGTATVYGVVYSLIDEAIITQALQAGNSWNDFVNLLEPCFSVTEQGITYQVLEPTNPACNTCQPQVTNFTFENNATCPFTPFDWQYNSVSEQNYTDLFLLMDASGFILQYSTNFNDFLLPEGNYMLSVLNFKNENENDIIAYLNSQAPTYFGLKDAITNAQWCAELGFTYDAEVLNANNAQCLSPIVVVVKTELTPDGLGYIVIITITGGTGNYTVNGNGVTDSTYTSNVIACGTSYYFEIEDGVLQTVIVQGDAPCNCPNSAGNMPDVLVVEKICAGAQSTAYTTTGEVVPQGYTLLYALHTSPDNQAGTIFATNNTGSFGFVNGMQYNTTYYISAVVAPTQPDGTPNLQHECTKVAAGVPVEFLAPLKFTIDEYCDFKETGDFTITFGVSGGQAPYQVTGDFAGTLDANQEATIITPEDAPDSYQFFVQDANGCATDTTREFYCEKTPIELLRFSGEATPQANLLTWATATETQASFFTLQRSYNGTVFENITQIQAQGESTQTTEYQFFDTKYNPNTTIQYYRLQLTNFNGTTTKLPTVVTIQRTQSNENNALQIQNIYPMPIYQQAIAQIYSPENQGIKYQIFDITGKLLQTQSTTLSKGNNNIPIDLQNYPQGIYIWTLKTNSQTISQKIIKQ